MQEDGTFDMLPKKEVAKLEMEIANLDKNLGGVKNMKTLPTAVFIVDPHKERNAFPKHASSTFRLSLSLIQTATPTTLDYVIPGNDDAIRAVRLITAVIADAVLEGKQGKQDAPAAEEAAKAE